MQKVIITDTMLYLNWLFLFFYRLLEVQPSKPIQNNLKIVQAVNAVCIVAKKQKDYTAEGINNPIFSV